MGSRSDRSSGGGRPGREFRSGGVTSGTFEPESQARQTYILDH
jgi:hypothetical protein